MNSDVNNAASLNPNPGDYICTKCNWIGKPHFVQYGEWPKFFLTCIFVSPFLFLLRFFRFALPYLPLFKFFVNEDNDAEWQVFPDMPYMLNGCDECKHPNSMVPLTTREGQHALYWAQKKEMEKQQTTK